MTKKKIRPFGEILLDLEVILDEMVDDHDLQWGDIRSAVMQHLRTHRPDAQEGYVDGGNPVDFYGPVESLTSRKANAILLLLLEEYRVGRPRKQWKHLMEKAERLFDNG